MKEKFIWLIGENNSKTANNNSYYFWKYSVDKNDDIEKYFILVKNKKNKNIYKNMSENEKKHVIWKNSVKHIKMFFKADMFFVTLSYLDVFPEKFLFKKLKFKNRTPIIYLQHGTLGIKKINYKGYSYNNNIFRFCIYNRLIKETYMKENDFKDYQLYYSPYHPRYTELVKKNDSVKNKNQILWFPTWREYMDGPANAQLFVHYMKRIVDDKSLKDYLKKNKYKFVICVHQFFDENILKDVYEVLDQEYFSIKLASKCDVMDEIARSKVLITDYSSLGFDFTFLNKPVILFQPDIDQYLKKRELYCTIEELEKYNIKSSKKLVELLVNETYTINEFFRSRLPEKIDYDYVREHKQIDKMYDDIAEMQRNKITFIGYNFFGIGGTVYATKSLAEGLLEQKYLVELLSLKRTQVNSKTPYGLNIKYIYFAKAKSIFDKFHMLFHHNPKNYSYLKYDPDKKLIDPYVGYGLTKALKNMKSKTVVSTRESIHLFVDEAPSPFIKNKVLFFHTDNKVINNIFPGLLDLIKERDIDYAAFVTEQNKEALRTENGLDNYKHSIVTGNALDSSRMITKEEIEPVEKKDVYNGIYLLRLSMDRVKDIDNLISFGKYLKDNKVKNIKLDVYGTGDAVNYLIDGIEDNEIYDYIQYKGLTKEVSEELKNHDVLIDLSVNNSFGMTYIEAILNGKKVYCMKNQGSSEVMKEMPDSYIDSFDNLVKKISNLDKITKEELEKNYDIIQSKYSRSMVSERFLELIGEKEEKNEKVRHKSKKV